MKTEEIHQSSSTVLCQTVPNHLHVSPQTDDAQGWPLCVQKCGHQMPLRLGVSDSSGCRVPYSGQP